MSSIEKKISKRIGKTIFEYKMIEPNDKILLAVSGGKDSLTLLYDFKKRIKSFPIKYSFEAVHIMSDFVSYNIKEVEEIFSQFDIKYNIVQVGVLKRLKEDKKMNCYWCAKQRRIELLKFAAEKGFNKIALAHNLDDIIQTFLMNIFFKAEVSTMLPVFKYKKFPFTIIRPLAKVKEKEIIKFIDEKNIKVLEFKCPYFSNSYRLAIKEMINKFACRYDHIKENIFKSMRNIKQEYLDII